MVKHRKSGKMQNLIAIVPVLAPPRSNDVMREDRLFDDCFEEVIKNGIKLPLNHYDIYSSLPVQNNTIVGNSSLQENTVDSSSRSNLHETYSLNIPENDDFLNEFNKILTEEEQSYNKESFKEDYNFGSENITLPQETNSVKLNVNELYSQEGTFHDESAPTVSNFIFKHNIYKDIESTEIINETPITAQIELEKNNTPIPLTPIKKNYENISLERRTYTEGIICNNNSLEDQTKSYSLFKNKEHDMLNSIAFTKNTNAKYFDYNANSLGVSATCNLEVPKHEPKCKILEKPFQININREESSSTKDTSLSTQLTYKNKSLTKTEFQNSKSNETILKHVSSSDSSGVSQIKHLLSEKQNQNLSKRLTDNKKIQILQNLNLKNIFDLENYESEYNKISNDQTLSGCNLELSDITDLMNISEASQDLLHDYKITNEPNPCDIKKFKYNLQDQTNNKFPITDFEEKSKDENSMQINTVSECQQSLVNVSNINKRIVFNEINSLVMPNNIYCKKEASRSNKNGCFLNGKHGNIFRKLESSTNINKYYNIQKEHSLKFNSRSKINKYELDISKKPVKIKKTKQMRLTEMLEKKEMDAEVVNCSP